MFKWFRKKTFEDILVNDISNLTQIKPLILRNWISDGRKDRLLDHIKQIEVNIFNTESNSFYRVLCLIQLSDGVLKLESEMKLIEVDLDSDLTCEREIILMFE